MEALEGKPGCWPLNPILLPLTPAQVEVTESSNQDALSGSSDLLELLLQEDSRSGTGSASSGSGLGSGSGAGSHEGGSTSASITRACPAPPTSPLTPGRPATGGVGRPGPASSGRWVTGVAWRAGPGGLTAAVAPLLRRQQSEQPHEQVLWQR